MGKIELNDTKEKVQRVVDELKLVTAQEERSLENRINGLKEVNDIYVRESSFLKR